MWRVRAELAAGRGLCWTLEKSLWALSSSWPPPASGVSSAGLWLELWADDSL